MIHLTVLSAAVGTRPVPIDYAEVEQKLGGLVDESYGYLAGALGKGGTI